MNRRATSLGRKVHLVALAVVVLWVELTLGWNPSNASIHADTEGSSGISGALAFISDDLSDGYQGDITTTPPDEFAPRLVIAESSSPLWSPGGDKLAFASAEGNRIGVATVQTGTSAFFDICVRHQSPDNHRIFKWKDEETLLVAASCSDQFVMVNVVTGAYEVVLDLGKIVVDRILDWDYFDGQIAFTCPGPQDGRIRRDADLCIGRTDTGTIEHVYHSEHFGVGFPSWSPTGSLIAFTIAGALVTIQPDENGLYGVRPPSTIGTQTVGAYPAWSPDGTQIAVSINQTPFPVEIWDLAGNETEIPGGRRIVSPEQVWSPDGQYLILEDLTTTPGDLHIYRRDGTFVRTLGAPDKHEYRAVWGPGSSLPPPPSQPVVILIHGIDPTHLGDANCGMNGEGSLQDRITDPSRMAGHSFSTECLIYKTRDGVAAGAKALEQLVERVKRQRQVDKVDIVAHSMGGLVSRYYIERLNGRGNVRSLTMLGTPNLGSTVAIPVCAFWGQWWFVLAGQYDQGACDMVPFVSPLLNYLNVFPGSHADVDYRVLTGWLGLNTAVPAPNDCIVSVFSASKGQSFSTELFPGDVTQTRVLHVKGDLVNWVVGCGPGNGETDDPNVQSRVAQILLESNGFASASGPPITGTGAGGITPTPPPDQPAPSTTASRSGLVAAGQTIDFPVTMPTSQTTSTFVFRAPAGPSATLTFALLRPGGSLVATADADVTYDSGVGFGGLAETHYIIANPAAGTWTMRVTGTVVPSSGWPYDLQALVPGGISITAKTGAGHYDVGQTIPLSADVAISSVAYAGGVVTATITKPDNTAAEVLLADAGGGSYTGSFGDTSACGLYQVTVTATGADNGTPFTRQDRTIAIIGVPGNVILDPCNADSDSDGLTDKDEIDVYATNPAAADTDDDGHSDEEEVLAGSDPNDPASVPATATPPPAVTPTRTPTPPAPSPTTGDVSCDGTVNPLDAALILQYQAGLIVALPCAGAGDVDGDGIVGPLDALMVLQFAAGLIPGLA